MLAIYEYKMADVLVRAPFDDITTKDQYVPRATAPGGVYGFFNAVLATGGAEALDVEPQTRCDMIFDK